MIGYYIVSQRLNLKRKGLSDWRVVSINKKDYGSAVHFLQRFIKSLELMSDELSNVFCLTSRLFEIFIIKKRVQFSVTSFVTGKGY